MKIDDLKGCFANVNDDMLLRENGLLYAENEELKEENQRLNNVLNGIDKILTEHIDECREELNTIYKTKDLEYINQCSKEFDVIRKNIEMIINKVNELKESDK